MMLEALSIAIDLTLFYCFADTSLSPFGEKKVETLQGVQSQSSTTISYMHAKIFKTILWLRTVHRTSLVVDRFYLHASLPLEMFLLDTFTCIHCKWLRVWQYIMFVQSHSELGTVSTCSQELHHNTHDGSLVPRLLMSLSMWTPCEKHFLAHVYESSNPFGSVNSMTSYNSPSLLWNSAKEPDVHVWINSFVNTCTTIFFCRC